MRYLLALILLGCSSVKTINLKDHVFNEVPKNIIWFQIAGLSPEHLALIDFEKTEMENSTCLGNMWTYNSYSLRPRPSESFLTQMTGKNNVKGTCEDFLEKPLWFYLSDRKFETEVMEVGADSNDTLGRAFECPEENEFKKITLISVGSQNKYQRLDLLDTKVFAPGRYQLACESCDESIFPSLLSIQDKISKNKKYNLFIFRDFSFFNYLKKGDFKSAGYFLKQLTKTYKSLLEKSNNLLLVTGSGMAKLDLPSPGAQWKDFEKNINTAPYRNDALLSLVLAEGPASEKFCGIYSETDLMERILMDPTKKFKKFLFW